MRWGLVPSWAKDPRKFSLLINARRETVTEKPAFKNAVRRRRCLIPADGYYEWHVADGRKRPYFIHRRDRVLFGLAALAETWIGPNGEETDSVAIVTAPASPDLARLHHRVPVTLTEKDFARWLDCSSDSADGVTALMVGPQEGEFAWHEISTRVNSADNDDAQLVLPITDEERAAEAPKPKRAAARKAAAGGGDDGQESLF
jgi:putative SOS response-associated peptidase YedK